MSAPWNRAQTRPSKPGWYLTQRPNEPESIDWRAWGSGGWWKQVKGGWIESFDGDGVAVEYEWREPGQSIRLDYGELVK